MQTKRIIITLAILLSIVPILMAQEPSLSNLGARHWKTANTLWGMASTLEQKKMAIAEYEKIKESDPRYPETFYKLGTLYFELAKEFKIDEYFELAKENYLGYKSLAPLQSEKIDDEIYLIESVRRLTQSNKAENNRNFAGVWVSRDYRAFSYIFRIKADGDSYEVKVSTADERVLETLDVTYDGEILSFTIKDVDRHGSPREISWGSDNGIIRVVCDVEEEIDFWKLSFNDGVLEAHCDHLGLYYLNGSVQRRRNFTRSWILVRR